MSMIEAGINEGDIVLVKCQPDAGNNDIVIARIGEEYTIKRLKVNEKGEKWLEPANSRYKPIKGRPFEIVGKIVYAIKKFRRRREMEGKKLHICIKRSLLKSIGFHKKGGLHGKNR